MLGSALLLGGLLGGCYRWADVKPAELPKLNGSTIGVARDMDGSKERLIAVSTRTVEAPDGRMVEIKGEVTLRIVTREEKFVFEHPVQAEIEDDLLVVRSGNRGETRIRMADIESAEVRQVDPGGVVVAGVAAGVLGGLAVFGLTTAALGD